ncbi:putative transposase [Streptomyces canus]|nr:putative transposase [Streptomyces canus]
MLQQSLRDAEAAYRNFFASLQGARKGPKMGAPRFKSRKDSRQSLRFTVNARWSITDSGRLNLPKVGAVKVKWSRTLPARPSSVTVIKDAAGRYFASFVIDTDPHADATAMPDSDQRVGIDLGLIHFAVLSNGTKIDSPRFLRRAEKKLKKAQRGLSRKQKGSKNREKARLKVARVHAQVADARREFHHQLSTKLIRDNQAIGVEDLAVKALARTGLAKSVHDAGWTQFVHMLEYKAVRYGRTLVKIGRYEPTSQTCSTCGAKDGPKPLHIRTWTCAVCGAVQRRSRIAESAGVTKSTFSVMAGPAGQLMPSMMRKSRWTPSGRAARAFWYASLSYAATACSKLSNSIRTTRCVMPASWATTRPPRDGIRDRRRPPPAWTAGPASLS